MNLSLIDSLLLGLVQGLTEFLPISSSGHLVLARQVLSIEDLPLLYDVFFHLTTLLAVFTYFYRDVLALISAGFRLLSALLKRKRPAALISRDIYVKMVIAILIGTVPAVFAGLFLKSRIESIFTTPSLAASFLMVTGILLLSTKYISKRDFDLTLSRSFLVGIGQACALLPGISRSGTTITVGMWLGLNPEMAARFSFLLAIPAILGAAVLEFSSVPIEILKSQFGILAAGGLTSYVSGLIAISLVMRFVVKGKFFWFGIYCIAVSLISLILIV